MKFFVKVMFFSFLLTNLLWSSELNKVEEEINKLYNDVSPSIVSIHYGSEDVHDFIGTGVVIDGDGDIVTIKRFLRDENIWVETNERKKLDAELLGSDPETGIAVLKVKGSLKPVKLCNIETLAPGDLLFIVGNSYGLKNGISISVFSGMRGDDKFLQLGNSVQPGNSGAGVFNSKGELAGIISFALGTSFFYEPSALGDLFKKELHLKTLPKTAISAAIGGPGVVISQKKMMELAKEIIRYGGIRRGWLGVFINEEDGRVIVKDIVDDSPAQKVGIKKGDIILEYNKRDVNNLHDFIRMVKETKPGTKISVKVQRGKKNLKMDIKIGKRPTDEKLFKIKEIIPSIKIFSEKEEIEKMKREIQELKQELEKAKKQLKEKTGKAKNLQRN